LGYKLWTCISISHSSGGRIGHWLSRRVTPTEMQSLERDDAFDRMIEEIIRANKEGKVEAAVALLRAKFSAPSSPRDLAPATR
jgi:hypothetical protein